MAMIEIKSVSKWYGTIQVLKDCTTSVNKGEVVIGDNGKATFDPSTGESILIERLPDYVQLIRSWPRQIPASARSTASPLAWP